MKYFKLFENFGPPQGAAVCTPMMPPNLGLPGVSNPPMPAIDPPFHNINWEEKTKKFKDRMSQNVDICNVALNLFTIRDLAHVKHLATESFSEHKALEEFYDGILSLTDQLIETWQGSVGEKIKITGVINLEMPETPTIVERLQDLSVFVRTFADSLSNKDHIKNICEEILDLTDRTIYKLKFLS